MFSRLEIGKLGEDIACEYLTRNGYRILGRNYRKKWDEIDVIAYAPDKTLVFVEVKTLRLGAGDSDLMPEDNLTRAKLRKLRRACEAAANSKPHSEFIKEKRGWRIDLITVAAPPDYNLTKSIKSCIIKQYENI